MRKYLFLFGLFFLASAVFGQKVPSANWSYTITNSNVKVGDAIEVVFTTSIPEGYHIYSNDYGDCPPVKAAFTYNQNSSFELVGSAKAIGSHHYVDEIFECEVADFENKDGKVFTNKATNLKKFKNMHDNLKMLWTHHQIGRVFKVICLNFQSITQ